MARLTAIHAATLSGLHLQGQIAVLVTGRHFCRGFRTITSSPLLCPFSKVRCAGCFAFGLPCWLTECDSYWIDAIRLVLRRYSKSPGSTVGVGVYLCIA
ncbi:hypothetical protein BO78DRAFT_101768 [Aspergillus sclerotiicarbonarius CBS 121057]|uniref:Uncharacterized protein n=1 Tax=Aspergillus sclerotiicarbonarius (strain CBS 121057 / IBT 28362) TaxID=1448318 RepID=A0A319EUF2_ASPSB|nr:hypothetical protein BO78DRAFT_101768 [Aspergillus sclerotiicarbonarius CBS 121057]